MAFACTDGNNQGMGHFGPAGTLPRARGNGLGAALLRACLRERAVAGQAETRIAWVGPTAFYERTVDAETKEHYVLLEKTP